LRHSNLLNKAGIASFLALGLTSLFFFSPNQAPAKAQLLDTATPTTNGVDPGSNAFITVTYIEPINVRSGPSSFDYPVVGKLPVGGTAPAIGRSPASEWIQITFPDAPRGTAWVYAANVTLSPPGFRLPIAEPPPTPAPLVTSTLNPTFLAQFQSLPTSTHLPTFTIPPPLVFPTYTNPPVSSSGHASTTWVILVLGLIGIVGILITSFRRR
jgi:hypothetical protein